MTRVGRGAVMTGKAAAEPMDRASGRFIPGVEVRMQEADALGSDGNGAPPSTLAPVMESLWRARRAWEKRYPQLVLFPLSPTEADGIPPLSASTL